MRFLYYDQVIEIEKNRRIVGRKNFSLSEEFLKGHFGETPLIPGVIFIEAMAQLLGWLIIYSHDFKLSAIISLVGDTNFVPDLRPGFSAEIHAEILSNSKTDSLGRAWIISEGRTIAASERLIYSHFHKINEARLRELFHYYSGIK